MLSTMIIIGLMFWAFFNAAYVGFVKYQCHKLLIDTDFLPPEINDRFEEEREQLTAIFEGVSRHRLEAYGICLLNFIIVSNALTGEGLSTLLMILGVYFNTNMIINTNTLFKANFYIIDTRNTMQEAYTKYFEKEGTTDDTKRDER